jgi:hypothetical protein
MEPDDLSFQSTHPSVKRLNLMFKSGISEKKFQIEFPGRGLLKLKNKPLNFFPGRELALRHGFCVRPAIKR